MDSISLEFNLRQMDILIYKMKCQLLDYEKNKDKTACCCIQLNKLSRDNEELLQCRENGARAYMRLHPGITIPETIASETMSEQMSKGPPTLF